MGKFTRPLPWYQGPKLHAFNHPGKDRENDARPRIHFLNRLGSGLHSEVHRVEIGGKIYALKLVILLLPSIFNVLCLTSTDSLNSRLGAI